MTKKYSIIHTKPLTEVRFHESPELEDFLAAIHELTAHKDTGRLRFWDISCGYDLSNEKIKQVGIASKGQPFPFASKSAILAPDDLSFGVTNIFTATSQDARTQRRVFRSKDEAMAWLEEPDQD